MTPEVDGTSKSDYSDIESIGGGELTPTGSVLELDFSIRFDGVVNEVRKGFLLRPNGDKMPIFAKTLKRPKDGEVEGRPSPNELNSYRLIENVTRKGVPKPVAPWGVVSHGDKEWLVMPDLVEYGFTHCDSNIMRDILRDKESKTRFFIDFMAFYAELARSLSTSGLSDVVTPGYLKQILLPDGVTSGSDPYIKGLWMKKLDGKYRFLITDVNVRNDHWKNMRNDFLFDVYGTWRELDGEQVARGTPTPSFLTMLCPAKIIRSKKFGIQIFDPKLEYFVGRYHDRSWNITKCLNELATYVEFPRWNKLAVIAGFMARHWDEYSDIQYSDEPLDIATVEPEMANQMYGMYYR